MSSAKFMTIYFYRDENGIEHGVSDPSDDLDIIDVRDVVYGDNTKKLQQLRLVINNNNPLLRDS